MLHLRHLEAKFIYWHCLDVSITVICSLTDLNNVFIINESIVIDPSSNKCRWGAGVNEIDSEKYIY